MRTLIIACVILAALVLYSGLVLFIGKIIAFCGRSDDAWFRNSEGLEDKAKEDHEQAFPG